MKPTLLVMAAGMGSRYGGLKQLDAVGPCGETIMDYSVYDALQCGFNEVVFVVREAFCRDFKRKIASKYDGRIKVSVVTQEPAKLPTGYSLSIEREKPWGTGQAVLVAREIITKPFAVINSDDFYGRLSFKVLSDYLQGLESSDSGKYCMVAFELANTLSESGAVSRGICTSDAHGNLLSVKEHTGVCKKGDIIVGCYPALSEHTIENKALTSMNMWGFTPDYMEKSYKLFCNFLDKNGGDPRAEFYIPAIVSSLIESGEASVKILSSPDKWFGVTYKEDRESVVTKLKELSVRGIYPSPLF